MICVSIPSLSSKDKFIATAKKYPFVEVRLDLNPFLIDCLADLFKIKNRKIYTLRPQGFSDLTRIDVFKNIISAEEALIDIEVETDEEFKREVIDYSRDFSTKVVLSFHDYDTTPSKEVLRKVIREAFNQGADIVKIATLAKNCKDVSRLLGLYDEFDNIVVLGMGEKGRCTRYLAEMFQAPFTFARLPGEGETAPGQLDYYEMTDIVKRLGLHA